MYFRMNGRSSAWPWATCATGGAIVAMCSPLLYGRGGGLLREPALIVLGAVHGDDGPHLVMTQPAQLGTAQLVDSNLRGLEPGPDVHARHGILLDPERRNEERVDHVFGLELHRHRAAHGDVKLVPAGEIVRGAPVCPSGREKRSSHSTSFTCPRIGMPSCGTLSRPLILFQTGLLINPRITTVTAGMEVQMISAVLLPWV